MAVDVRTTTAGGGRVAQEEKHSSERDQPAAVPPIVTVRGIRDHAFDRAQRLHWCYDLLPLPTALSMPHRRGNSSPVPLRFGPAPRGFLASEEPRDLLIMFNAMAEFDFGTVGVGLRN